MLKTFVALTAAAMMLGACGTTGGMNSTDFLTAVKEIAQDPNCGHTDRIQGNLGGLGGNNLALYFERTCPAKGATPAPPAP